MKLRHFMLIIFIISIITFTLTIIYKEDLIINIMWLLNIIVWGIIYKITKQNDKH
jgi:hypothetical protein